MLTVVVARYRENVEWVQQLTCNVVIVDKAQIGNTGREAASWLWFIVQHYEGLRGDYVFAQGNPFEHCPDFVQTLGTRRHYGQRLTCDRTGAPHHPGLPLAAMAQALAIEPLPENLEFTMGAQFQVSHDALRRRPWELYCHAKELARREPQAPWVFERLWDYLIPINQTAENKHERND